MATTYASDFTKDLLKDPVAPTPDKILDREKFFREVFVPEFGGDSGVLNTFYGGGGYNQGGSNPSIDGYPKMPSYDQFIGGTGTYSHRHDGKIYNMPSIKDNKAEFEAAYKSYQDKISASNTEKDVAYRQEVEYTKTARKLADLSNVSKVNLDPVNAAVKNLSAARNYGASDLGTKLNFQVSDDQIIQDLNASKIARLNNVVETGNAQIVGIQGRIDEANKFIQNLKVGDPRRKVSRNAIKSMTSDLSSVNTAIQSANEQIKNYKPITASAPEAAKEITSFRSFLQLPEERASQQLRQIDPDSYNTSVALGQKYRQMATAPIGQTQNAQTEAFRAELEKGYRDYSKSPIGKTQDAQTEAYRAQLQKEIQGYSLGKIGATTTPEAEALRRQVEGETAAQLALGSRLGAEEQRQYQQYSRGAQAARGNIFGVAPAVEEAVTTGMAGEARKQARYGAASQFLSSGQTTSDALARDTQLREALQQGRYQVGGAMLTSGQTVSDAMARDVQLRNALEQSKLGAGAQFMASGQSMSDAAARDVGLRNALEQSRLGAAQGFIASGPTMYNMASQRLGTQQAMLNNYLAASQPRTTGTFQGTSSTANPYAYVNPNAGFIGAQTSANVYGSLLDYASQTYGAQVGAISRQQSGAQQFADIAGGVASLAKVAAPGGFFGAPSSGAFFR